ncbi:MAG TPA: hypothetical protein VN844_10970 [Pyrinomonadaceae bacterium]|nr:hypothetical protein [Pyrinomonadaceae bacterium]
MTSVLSSISGYFSKSLILGTFLPVVIFIVLALLLLVPYLPPSFSVSMPLDLGQEWRIISISFVAIVMSGLIYNLNIPILRLYEGYPWQDSWIGLQLKTIHRNRFDAAQLRIDTMRAALRTMDVTVNKDPLEAAFINEVIDSWKALGGERGAAAISERRWLKAWRAANADTEANDIKTRWQLIDNELRGQFSGYRRTIQHTYPDERGLILPTRLGNAIRSFEYYSHREYGIDSIEIWPRLVAVIPKEYAVSIDDSKTTFDFMLNSSLLSLLLCVLILFSGLLYPASLLSLWNAAYWILTVVALGLLAYFFYRLSINRAHAWGLLIKSAFDLYRWELLKKLGYAQQPKHRLEERELWGEISRQAIYGDRFDKRMLEYSESSPLPFPSLQSETRDPKLEVTRGVKTTGDAAVVYLRIRNTDSAALVKGITVKDRLSDDLDFEWDSARVGNDKVAMSGTNPYEFRIGDLQPEAETILTYKVINKKREALSVQVI